MDIEVIGTGRQAFHHTGQEPRETDTDGTADPAERDALAQQLFNPQALLGRNALVHSMSAQLATTYLTLMMLLPMAGMAIFLVPVSVTGWTRISENHGCCCLPDFPMVFDQQ
jgi:hypothetical protein